MLVLMVAHLLMMTIDTQYSSAMQTICQRGSWALLPYMLVWGQISMVHLLHLIKLDIL